MAIIGHSERRQFFNETDEGVNKKAAAAMKEGLVPIICVGETLAERQGGSTLSVVERQTRGALKNLPLKNPADLVIAYEPVWAIGTGKTATPQIAADAHKVIRAEVRKKYGAAADDVRILYGGSVKPDNVKSLMAQPDIDGSLVGGASLDPNSFSSIVNF